MKRVYIVILFSALLTPPVFSQTVDNNNSYTINAFDINGKVLTNKSTDILGTPMLNSDWGKGWVKFKSGHLIKEIELQFNLAENELYFRKDNLTYAFVDPLSEFELSYLDENTRRTSLFRCGYPLNEENTELTFYEVVADGRSVQLLKKTKKLVQTKANYGQSAQKEYKELVQWYIYDSKRGIVNRIKKDIGSVKEALPSFTAQIDQFAKENKYKFRSEEEIIALLLLLNKQ